MVVDSRISAAKVCDFHIVLTDFDRQNSGIWLRD